MEIWLIGRIGRQTGKWSRHLTAWSENLKQATCFCVPSLLLPVLGGFLHIFDQMETFFAGPVVFFSNRESSEKKINWLVKSPLKFLVWIHRPSLTLPFRPFLIAELSDGVGMGNQLSTWNLSIQSAVDGENFNYNPDYNQVPFFLSSYLDINLFSEHTSLFTATKWRCVNPSLDGKIALSP